MQGNDKLLQIPESSLVALLLLLELLDDVAGAIEEPPDAAGAYSEQEIRSAATERLLDETLSLALGEAGVAPSAGQALVPAHFGVGVDFRVQLRLGLLLLEEGRELLLRRCVESVGVHFVARRGNRKDRN